MNLEKVLKVVLPLVVLAAGIGGLRYMVTTKPEPNRETPSSDGLLVETQRVEAATHTVAVQASGQVIPAQQMMISSEVQGRVRWQSPELVAGGRFARGASVLRIDARDYQLNLDSRSAEVRRAQLELQLERSRQAVAQREWEAFGNQDQQGDQALALRQPQLETAEVSVRSAESAVERARLNLSKTTVRAPFNAMVVSENVDLGQVVGPSSQLATLVGTDAFHVRVSIPVEQLAIVQVPDRNGDGSEVRVTQQLGSQLIERIGHVVRLLPDVDPVGAMARVLVAIDDPLGLTEENQGSLPMLLGSYVDVQIDAGTLQDVIEVPRLALREGRRVLVRNAESRLEVRSVEVAWGREDSVLVAAGLASGDQVITSRVPTAVRGMLLRVAEPTNEATAARTPAKQPTEVTQ